MTTYPIEVKDLETYYGSRKILDKITLNIEQGKITVVLGGSGCGKSTLLKHMIGLYYPTAGTVRLLGEDIHALSEDKREKLLPRIGMLFQNGALLSSMTIEDNVALPIREHTNLPNSIIQDIVWIKLMQVELSHAAKLYPGELSGGMKKRAALARAIALDPDILFCDEPSAGLDPLTSSGLDQLLLNIKEQFNMTVIVVTHELASIEAIADHAIMLDQGKVLSQGTLDHVRQMDHPMIQSFFGRKIGASQNLPSALHFFQHSANQTDQILEKSS
ncbi:MAG: ATP-binding cassette domain-containing protein [Desulfobacterales bacterium]|nr:ATP-binding cassette domain-containing protein [Desulfobacterales bacterium]